MSVQVSLGNSCGGKPITHDFDTSPVLRISGSPGNGCLLLTYSVMEQMQKAGYPSIITDYMADTFPVDADQEPVPGVDHMLYEVAKAEANGSRGFGIFSTWGMEEEFILKVQKHLSTAPGKFLMVTPQDTPLTPALAKRSSQITSDGIRPKFPTLSSRVFSYRERLFLFDCPRKVLKMFTVNE